MIMMGERQETRFLTPEQVARMLSFKERKVIELLRNKVIPGIKIGREWRVDPADLERYIEQQKRK